MRHIDTTTTRQLATAIANAEARSINAQRTYPKPDHTVVADPDHVDAVEESITAIAAELNKQAETDAGTYDPSALRRDQVATIEDLYVNKRIRAFARDITL